MPLQPPLNLLKTVALGFHTRRTSMGDWSCAWPIVLGELLEELEARFGPRDRAWTPLGIMFGGIDSRIRIHSWSDKQVIIRLEEACGSACPAGAVKASPRSRTSVGPGGRHADD
jgi:hypothetical protein